MPLWLAAAPLVLASRSAVRRSLLQAAGIPVEVCPADLDERVLEARAPLQAPVAIAAFLAREKALAVAGHYRGRLVVGADQTLSLDGKRFAKPADRSEADIQLRTLCGRAHELYSAVAFVQDGAVLFEYVDAAHLTMRSFSPRFLDAYLDAAGAAATASVGGYQLEAVGVHLFERIEGDHFTILGLPLLPLLAYLRAEGSLA